MLPSDENPVSEAVLRGEEEPPFDPQNEIRMPEESKGHPREPANHRRVQFLGLPVEIRLLIYHHLVHLTSMRHKAYFLQAIARIISPGPLITTHTPTPLLSPHRPLGYLPSSLLRTCRRVYAEARAVPFHENEFVFVAWFSSSVLSAARAAVGALAGSQRTGMRFARLEVRVRDLCCEAGVRAWELWGFWRKNQGRV
ncbi:hypothetical protein VTK56DRAFT_1885 [Thermocarpiscus australiensis]